MDKIMEGLFKILFITILVCMAIIMLPITYIFCILWDIIHGQTNIIDMINDLNEDVKTIYIIPIFEQIKEIWDI